MGNNVNHDGDDDDDDDASDAITHTIPNTSFSHASAPPFVH